MKKLLGIVVLGLLFSGNAYSVETNIKCTFEKGRYIYDKDRTGETFNNNENIYEDISISLDTQNKKIISYPFKDGAGFRLSYWEDNEIIWEINWGEELRQTYYLDSITAKLRTDFVSKIPDKEQVVEIYYNCSLVEKKLF